MVAALALALVPASPAGAEFAPAPDDTWGTNGRVYAVAQVGDRIFLGGTFTEVRSRSGGAVQPRNRLAALDATTGDVLPWRADANGEVYSLAPAPDGSSVFAAGAFTNVAGAARSRVAQLDAATGAARRWTANANNKVWAIDVAGGQVFLGGDFTVVKGVARNRAAAVSASTGAPSGWNPNANGQVRALRVAPSGANVYVGGKFTSVSGLARNQLAAVRNDASGTVVAAFAPNVAFPVLDVDASGTTVFAAYGGAAGGRSAAFDAATGQQRWLKSADGDVQTVAFDAARNRVYVGGHFGKFANDATRKRFVTANPNTGVPDNAFAPTVNLGTGTNRLGVWTIEVTSSRLYMGGDFDFVSGVTQPRFAQFT